MVKIEKEELLEFYKRFPAVTTELQERRQEWLKQLRIREMLEELKRQQKIYNKEMMYDIVEGWIEV